MSIWFFLEEFLTDIPTLSMLLRKVMALILLLAAALMILAIYNVPTPIATALHFGVMFIMMRLVSRYRQQRKI